MKRILTLALLLCALSVTPSHAKIIRPPGSTYGDQVRIVKQGYTGSISQPIESRSEFTVIFDGGCIRIVKVTTPTNRTTTYQWGEVVETIDTYGTPTTEVLVEFCP